VRGEERERLREKLCYRLENAPTETL
jgi:hypothetical protein